MSEQAPIPVQNSAEQQNSPESERLQRLHKIASDLGAVGVGVARDEYHGHGSLRHEFPSESGSIKGLDQRPAAENDGAEDDFRFRISNQDEAHNRIVQRNYDGSLEHVSSDSLISARAIVGSEGTDDSGIQGIRYSKLDGAHTTGDIEIARDAKDGSRYAGKLTGRRAERAQEILDNRSARIADGIIASRNEVLDSAEGRKEAIKEMFDKSMHIKLEDYMSVLLDDYVYMKDGKQIQHDEQSFSLHHSPRGDKEMVDYIKDELPQLYRQFRDAITSKTGYQTEFNVASRLVGDGEITLTEAWSMLKEAGVEQPDDWKEQGIKGLNPYIHIELDDEAKAEKNEDINDIRNNLMNNVKVRQYQSRKNKLNQQKQTQASLENTDRIAA